MMMTFVDAVGFRIEETAAANWMGWRKNASIYIVSIIYL
jgi:hypothetical protein